MNPKKVLDVKYEIIIQQLEAADYPRTAKKLFEKYKYSGGKLGFDCFYRELRHIIEKARRNKLKIIGDNNGYRMARNDEDWALYEKRQRSRITNEIITFAKCSNKTVWSLLHDWFGGGKKGTKGGISVQTNMFGNVTRRQ